ncbi:MAG: hypothetical protein HQL73_01395 [Magnetococcales bacterium]|nr:hypothetical protein [Magnetococcales bacterium]
MTGKWTNNAEGIGTLHCPISIRSRIDSSTVQESRPCGVESMETKLFTTLTVISFGVSLLMAMGLWPGV